MTQTTIELIVIVAVFLALRGLWRFIEEQRAQKLADEIYKRSVKRSDPRSGRQIFDDAYRREKEKEDYRRAETEAHRAWQADPQGRNR